MQNNVINKSLARWKMWVAQLTTRHPIEWSKCICVGFVVQNMLHIKVETNVTHRDQEADNIFNIYKKRTILSACVFEGFVASAP